MDPHANSSAKRSKPGASSVFGLLAGNPSFSRIAAPDRRNSSRVVMFLSPCIHIASVAIVAARRGSSETVSWGEDYRRSVEKATGATDRCECQRTAYLVGLGRASVHLFSSMHGPSALTSPPSPPGPNFAFRSSEEIGFPQLRGSNRKVEPKETAGSSSNLRKIQFR